MLMNYKIVPVTSFVQNCTILWCERTRAAAVVDPGGDVDLVLDAARELGVRPVVILLTHGHVDHVGGAGEMAKRLSIPIEGPNIGDLRWLEALDKQCGMFSAPKYNVQAFVPTRWLNHNDQVTFGDCTLEILHCPGHTPGHVVFFHRPSQLALVGDVIFQDGIGRTDFPLSNFATLIDSIKQRLFPLGDAVKFIPGHGPMSTFGVEKANFAF